METDRGAQYALASQLFPVAFSTNRFSSSASEADLSTFYLRAPQVVSKLLKHTCSKGYDKDGSVETELLVG